MMPFTPKDEKIGNFIGSPVVKMEVIPYIPAHNEVPDPELKIC